GDPRTTAAQRIAPGSERAVWNGSASVPLFRGTPLSTRQLLRASLVGLAVCALLGLVLLRPVKRLVWNAAGSSATTTEDSSQPGRSDLLEEAPTKGEDRRAVETTSGGEAPHITPPRAGYRPVLRGRVLDESGHPV